MDRTKRPFFACYGLREEPYRLVNPVSNLVFPKREVKNGGSGMSADMVDTRVGKKTYGERETYLQKEGCFVKISREDKMPPGIMSEIDEILREHLKKGNIYAVSLRSRERTGKSSVIVYSSLPNTEITNGELGDFIDFSSSMNVLGGKVDDDLINYLEAAWLL